MIPGDQRGAMMDLGTRRSQLCDIIGGFARRRVLVIGDMVADAYIVGRPVRISREAPVLVLHHREEFLCPGGAANVAHNLSALGADVTVGGFIGPDTAGDRLHAMLVASGIDTEGLIVDPRGTTATKTRIVARGEQEIQQQIVRIDRIDPPRVDKRREQPLTGRILSMLARVEGVIVADYENGVISASMLASVIPDAQARGLVITVDSHGDLFRFHGVTLATPNQPEAEGTLGRSFATTSQVEAGGEELRNRMDADGLLITRGNQGMSLFQRGREPEHLAPTNVREVFDPTGAGDTVSAVITLATLAGANMFEAAVISNIAAGEVVRKLGAATITADELQAAVRQVCP
jgi:rfaE bifunctional protein kinase chain/domain